MVIVLKVLLSSQKQASTHVAVGRLHVLTALDFVNDIIIIICVKCVFITQVHVAASVAAITRHIPPCCTQTGLIASPHMVQKKTVTTGKIAYVNYGEMK